jgi:hypothetical protein
MSKVYTGASMSLDGYISGSPVDLGVNSPRRWPLERVFHG